MPETATKKLTPKEDSFVEHYAICLNGAEAARLATYAEGSARQTAHKLLSKDYIKEAIQRRISEKAVSKEGVLAILGDIARSSMADFVSLHYGRDGIHEPYIDLAKAAQNNKLHLVKKVKRTRRTRKNGKDEYIEEELSIELYDKQAAAVTLARHHGLLNDKLLLEIDWRKELEEAGLNPADEFNELVKRQKERIAASARGDDGGGDQGSESTT